MPDPSPDSSPRRRAPKQPAAKHSQSTTPASASPESLAFPRDRISKLRSATLAWYDTHGRSLPWRQQQDPYRIWLSEIMLQQTTVAAVIPYFQRFITHFPDVQTLAAASVDDVLRLWEGLGYYSRARNLHQAAIMVVQNFAGQFPADVKLLQSLPGIGRYTAGAIASFAFDLPAPIVEANTERLYARLLALQDDVRSSSAQKQLWQFAESIVPAKRAADFNQAVMDLGAQVCRPEDPNCPQCPLLKCCQAFQNSLQHELPRRQPRTPITLVSELAVVPFQSQRFLLRRRAPHERWAGMWDATRLEISDERRQQIPCPPSHKRSTKPRERSLFPQTAALLDPMLQQQIADQCGAVPGILLDSMELTYSVTRYRVQLLTVLCEVSGTTTKLPDTEWFAAADLASLPLSRTGRQIADWLQSFREGGGSQ